MKKNVELCGDNTKKITGAGFWNKQAFKEEWQDTAQSLYGLTDLLQVSHVLESSPADLAGLVAGDVIITANGKTPPVGEDAATEFRKNLNEITENNDVVSFKVNRTGQEQTIYVSPVSVCDFSVGITEDDNINAYADGKRMVLTTGMMDFARTDQELALVVAHELAHNSEKHIEAQQTNAVVGGLLGLIVDIAAAYGGVNTQGTFTDAGMRAGAMAYSVDFERNADYVGLYYMSRAGYEIDGAANFWRRMSLRKSKAINMTTTHPSNAERYLGIEQSIKEIKTKIASNQPLIPEQVDEEPVQEALVTTKGDNGVTDEPENIEESLSLSEDSSDAEAGKKSDPISSFFKKLFKRGDKTDEAEEE